MIQTVRKAWAIPELRKKIIFTLLILLIYRIGNAISVPYVNVQALGDTIESMGTTYLGLLNAMSGGAFSMATVFALGIQPYINSSIIIQLLTVAIPALERMAREGGEAGRKKIQAITRYATVAIALLQAFGYYMMMKNYNLLTTTGVWPAIVIIISFVAGASFLMWLGEQVNEFGVGNGISMILFAGIISRVPTAVESMVRCVNIWSGVRGGTLTVEYVQKRLRLHGGGGGGLPLPGAGPLGHRADPAGRAGPGGADRLCQRRRAPHPRAVRQAPGGPEDVRRPVLPSAHEGEYVRRPARHLRPVHRHAACDHLDVHRHPRGGTVGYAIYSAIDTQSLLYMVAYFLMIIGFSYFYATIQFNPVEISNNLRKNGGFIPGFRPGLPTSQFISKVLSKITLFGAIYLGIVAIVPLVAGKILPVSSLAIGGTSVIIVVGVALETVQALESQMLMRQYKGFLE